jgi:hypothetical protein
MITAHFARGAAHKLGEAALHTLEFTLPTSLSVHEFADYALPVCAAYAASVMKALHLRH